MYTLSQTQHEKSIDTLYRVWDSTYQMRILSETQMKNWGGNDLYETSDEEDLSYMHCHT